MKKIIMALLAITLSIGTAMADWPTKTVKILTSLPVGSGPDTTTRKLAEVLSEKWRVPVVIDNRPGASGGIALDTYNRESADGHTIGFFDAGSIVGYPIMFNKAESVAAIEPVLPLLTVYMTLFASPQIRDYAMLKDEIAKNPTYGSWANGSAGHLAGASFSSLFDVPINHIVYKDYGTWFVDTSNKAVTYGFGSIGSSKGMAQLGKLHYLAILAPRRDPAYPTVPTIKEFTGKDLPEPPSWVAYFVHKSVPANVKKQIESDMRSAAADPRVRDLIARQDYTPYGNMTLVEFNLQISRQIKEFTQMSQKFNITVK